MSSVGKASQSSPANFSLRDQMMDEESQKISVERTGVRNPTTGVAPSAIEAIAHRSWQIVQKCS